MLITTSTTTRQEHVTQRHANRVIIHVRDCRGYVGARNARASLSLSFSHAYIFIRLASLDSLSNIHPDEYVAQCTDENNRRCEPCKTCLEHKYTTNCNKRSTPQGVCADCVDFDANDHVRGYYRDGCTGSGLRISNGMIKECSNRVNENQYYTDNHATSNACTYKDCSATTCNSGKYLKACGEDGGRNMGTCTDYGTCEIGQYLSGCSGQNPGICTDCGTCETGQYLSGCSGQNPGTCTNCTNTPHTVDFYVRSFSTF